jgi:hypothetical protein
MSIQSSVSSQITAPVVGSQLLPAKSKPLTMAALPREIFDKVLTFTADSYKEVVSQFPLVNKQLYNMKVFPSNGHLNLRNFADLTDVDLHQIIDLIVESKRKVTSIDLEGCVLLTDKGTLALSKLKSLTQLNLSGCYNLKSLQFLSELTNLQVVKLNNCPVLESIKPLGNLQQLRILELNGYTRIQSDEFEVLGNLHKLEELGLRGQMIKSLACLGDASNLRALELYDCEFLENIDPISKFQKLERVNLGYCHKIKSLEALNSLTSTEIIRPDPDKLGRPSLFDQWAELLEDQD